MSRTRRTARGLSLLMSLALVAGASVVAPTVNAVSPDVVISQVYGGGGNTGATYTHDFVELFNRGTTTVSLTGMSVQYASATGTGSFGNNAVAQLAGSLAPGQYYLVQLATGGAVGAALPTPNATGTVNMSGSSGKVVLVNSTAGLACNGGSTPCSVDQLALIKDLVGYGTANFFEGTAAVAALSNTTAALRNANGATDTDSNSADFTVGAPNPRNTPPPDSAPAVASTVPADGASSVPYNTDVVVTFTEAVNVTSAWYTLTCSLSGAHTAALAGGPTTFTINPDTDFVSGDTCTFVVLATQVSDQDANDPPDNMAVNFTVGFSTVDACTLPYTPVSDIQGSGSATPIPGTVTTQAVVVGDNEGASPALRGFFVQDPNGDDDTATSDGIFVFNGNNNGVSLGDVVRISGKAEEFQGQTQISSVTSIVDCGTGSVAPTDVTLPFASATTAEQYEGMLVRLPQTLYVTEHFQLGRFGQVVLSSEARLRQPTNVVLPGAPALALQAQNNLNRIILDDASQAQNPDPILFARGGNPLSASNTLRGGDTATGTIGVMTYTWGGNSASPNAYRVRPFNALGGYVNFEAVNLRPTYTPEVGGSVKVVGMNLLNFFNTFDGLPDNVDNCANGFGGAPTDCRGADTQAEFDRQWPKTVAAIVSMNPDVVEFNEIENDGYGPDSSLAFLVDKLNAATAPGTYTFIDADADTGQLNALGTDAIKVGMIYKPAVVNPVGQTAVLNTVAFVNGGDAAPRNRPSLLQAFEVNATGAIFLVNANHLKSKGSACDAPAANDGQGNCNLVRVNAVNELLNWLAADPTGTGDADILTLGDYNSYAKEDPITTLEAGGFTNLVNRFGGENAYSYVFDGQWGYLDHALGSATLTAQVTGVANYHIDADEPSVLDYNTDFKTANLINTLYAPDQFRISDHDPVIVGLIPAWDFSGFFSPVDNPPAINQMKAGAAVPVKFSLGGDRGLAIFAAGSPTSEPITCDAGAVTDSVESTTTAGGSSLAYDPLTDQYIYTWKTSRAWAGTCRQLTVSLTDGTDHTALFTFTK